LSNISIHHSKESDSKGFDVLLSPAVVVTRKPGEMRFSVYLNRQLQFGAVEIDDVLVNAILPTEFVPEHLATREMAPENSLSFGKMTSEETSSRSSYAGKIGLILQMFKQQRFAKT
jgi:hypothetical protein